MSSHGGWLSGKKTLIQHGGERITLCTLAARTGLPIWTLYQRHRRGDRGERLTRPSVPRAKPYKR